MVEKNGVKFVLAFSASDAKDMRAFGCELIRASFNEGVNYIYPLLPPFEGSSLSPDFDKGKWAVLFVDIDECRSNYATHGHNSIKVRANEETD